MPRPGNNSDSSSDRGIMAQSGSRRLPKWISALQPLLMSRRSSSTGSIAISNKTLRRKVNRFHQCITFRWGTIPGTTHKLGPPKASLRHRIFSTRTARPTRAGETAGSYVTHRLPLSRAMRSAPIRRGPSPHAPSPPRGRSKPPCGGRSIRPRWRTATTCSSTARGLS